MRFVLVLGALLIVGTLLFAAPLTARGQHGQVSPTWDPVCYLTYAQTETYLQNLASTYPELASLSDAGLSWEGTRHLWLLSLTNRALPGPRPAIYLIAAHNPRNIAGPQVLLRFATLLAQGYGVDPDVTYLLDNRVVHILTLSNPDGYHELYTNANFTHLKNTRTGCTAQEGRLRGVNLNYNYPVGWAFNYSDPCVSLYQGTGPLSEPESQAILSSIDSSQPGLVLSLGAPGVGRPSSTLPTILYPWGYQQQPPPDQVGLDALGYNLGRLNNTARPDVRRHNMGTPHTGLLDDTVYGALDIPVFTLNVGPHYDPICSTLDTIWAEQRPALLYAAKVVAHDKGETFGHAFGPTAGNVGITVSGPQTISVTAVLSANYGTVSGAIYSIDTLGCDGCGTAMSGQFGGGVVTSTATINTSGLPNGRHMVIVQGRSSTLDWGVVGTAFFTVSGNTHTPTPVLSPTRTLTPTHTRTANPTHTHTPTPLPPTATSTPTVTTTPPSGTNSPTPPTATPSNTATITPSRTQTGTRTPTQSPPPTLTRTPSHTRTPTSTRTPTFTRTPGPPNTATPLPCVNYSDVGPSHFFYQAVHWLACRGIVSGYPDGTFRPYNPATRAQIAKMVVLGEGWTLYEPVVPTFSDVAPGEWFYAYVETALANGVVGGYADGTFRPYSNVTRGQLSKMIVLARCWPLLDPLVPHFTDVPPGSTFYTHIETAHYHGVLGGYGDGTFRPNTDATRGQLSKMLHNALTQEPGVCSQ